MSKSSVKKTTVIVLKKTHYQESSVIVTTISPDFGKLNFILKGEKKITRKKAPTIDLFREFTVEFKEQNTDLLTPSVIELINAFDNIAFSPDLFLEACNISKFLTKNIYQNVPCKYIYRTLKNILTSLSQQKNFSHPQTIIKLIFLYENGILPQELLDPNTNSLSKKQKLLQDFLLYGTGKKTEPPKLTCDYWESFSDWVTEQCKVNNLRL